MSNMPKLLFLHICDYAFQGPSNKTNLIGIFENINAKDFPAIHPNFSIVTNIQRTGEETKKRYNQEIIIKDKDGNIISRANKDLVIDKPNGKAIFAANFLMTKFPSAGEYKIIILIDNNEIGGGKFNVTKM